MEFLEEEGKAGLPHSIQRKPSKNGLFDCGSPVLSLSDSVKEKREIPQFGRFLVMNAEFSLQSRLAGGERGIRGTEFWQDPC
jgi:hypothetical protein